MNSLFSHLNACNPQSGFNVLSQSEWNFLWHPQSFPFLKADIVINVDNL